MSGPLEFPLQKIKSITNNFSKENFIGEGFLGKIYEGQLSLSGELVDVAVRRLDYSLRLQEILFEKEISVLTRFNHKNMVSVVGFCYENDEMLIISERVARGSLSKNLSDPRLTWMRRLQISVGAASALSYLHNEVGHDYSVVHQNINIDSILLDENWEAKVSGFEYCMTIPAGNLDLAYEKLRIGIYKSDVFSIGVFLFELLCGKEAFASNSSFQASLAVFQYENGKLHEFVDPGLYSQMDPKSFNIFAKIAYNCLTEQRVPPTMNEVLERLERALKVQQMHENKRHSTVAVERTLPEHLKLKLKSLEHMRIPLADIVSATKNFSKDFIVSSGGFGSVYKADLDHVDKEYCKELENKNVHEVPKKQRSTVAIKRIIDTEDEMAEQGFYTEIEMLTSYKHSNIITLLGFCDDGGAMILIYDYASKGSLNYHLQNMSNNHNDSWAQRVKICLDAAKGLSYLHTTNKGKQKIVHRDIKSANILLDANFEAKIGDFGLSVFITEGVEHYTWSSRTVAGTHGYIDPQYSKDGKLKMESDVYSFGVVMFEILCGKVAYDRKYVEKNNKGLALLARQHFNEGAIMEMVDPKIKEEIKGSSQESLDMFSEIAYKCLAEKQAERPTMEEVVMVLEIVIFLQGRSFTQLLIPSEDISKATKNFTQGYIGEGSYAKVYRAELELTIEDAATGEMSKKWTTVAIKCITASQHGQRGYNAEIEILSSCKHRNIISLLSYSYYESNLILVYEYASNGSLDDYLTSSTNLTWVQRIKIGIDIASALDYLHTRVDEPMIIHRDVKSGNILLGQNLEAKIADFGLSRFHHANQDARSVYTLHVAGTYMYMCPEYQLTGRLTTMVDIYSFGVVLFELLSGRLPNDSIYLEENNRYGIAHVARQHFKDKRINEMVDLKIMEEVDELKFTLHKGPNQDSLRTYSDIAYRCVAKAQDERPTAKEILHELHKALLYQENHKDSLLMPFEEIMVVTKDFGRENLIGSGRFGNVYEGEVTRGSESSKVIAKRFHGKEGQGEEHFFMELEILYDYKHENIIGLEGYCNENHEKIVVYEHASNRSLDRHLGNVSLTWTKRLKICIDIARGLVFLHRDAPTNETVIHRDIKSANILLTDDWKAKISDLGCLQ